MATTHKSFTAATQAVRDLINETRRHWILRTQRKEQFNQVCAALDVIDDTASAIEAYAGCTPSAPVGERYLLTYGILEALYLQQNAVMHLCAALSNALDLPYSFADDDVLLNIRDTRNRASGHPTRRDRETRNRAGSPRENKGGTPTFHQIVRISMGHAGFDLYTYNARSELTTEFVDVAKMIDQQRPRLREVLRRLVDALRKKDAEHCREFRMTRLADLLAVQGLEYIWRTLGEGRACSDGRVAAVGATRLLDALERFSDELVRRGIDVGTYPGVHARFENARWGLVELSAYYEGSDECEVRSDRGANVFAEYIRAEFDALQQMAREVDEEYGQDNVDSETPNT